MTLQPLKGFRDFLPAEARKRQWLREQMIRVFEKWGYEPLETPMLESYELFAGEIGEDEKLFYKFKDLGGREVMLRYDQTVPTCRVIGQYCNRLKFPFRRYQIQSAFRAENPQKGRYREFTQVDLDIFGVASPLADAEIIAATLDLYRSLGFKQAVALINNRDLLQNIPYPAIAAIDKLAKVGEERVVSEITKGGISAEKAKGYLSQVKSLQPNAALEQIFTYLKSAGFPDSWYRFEPTLARALSYSQGPIWEIRVPEYGNLSVGGGERYDALIGRITGKDIPGTGIGIGFDRTLEAAEAVGLVPPTATATKVLITVFSPRFSNSSLSLAAQLRQRNTNTEIYPDFDAKLDKQLKYAADKGIPYVVIIGPEEVAKEVVTLKDMASGEQKQVTADTLISSVSKI